jgi:phage terminase Nu1 subunit (DNA packaging protein)
MAMMARLLTLSGLEAEIGVDRRTLGKALSGVDPDGKSNGRNAWFVKTALSAVNRSNGKEELDPAAEKARLDKARADLAELDLAKKRGEVVDVATVSATVSSEYATVRATLMAMPSKLASMIEPGMARPVIQDLVLKEITDALEALSADGDAKLAAIAQGVGVGEGQELETAAETQGLAVGQ